MADKQEWPTMYAIDYQAIDGSDGGTIAEGFRTVEEAREWARENLDLSEFEGDVVRIVEMDDGTYGELIEELN